MARTKQTARKTKPRNSKVIEEEQEEEEEVENEEYFSELEGEGEDLEGLNKAKMSSLSRFRKKMVRNEIEDVQSKNLVINWSDLVESNEIKLDRLKTVCSFISLPVKSVFHDYFFKNQVFDAQNGHRVWFQRIRKFHRFCHVLICQTFEGKQNPVQTRRRDTKWMQKHFRVDLALFKLHKQQNCVRFGIFEIGCKSFLYAFK